MTAAMFMATKTSEWNEKQKFIKTKDVGGEGEHVWQREAFMFMPQSGHKGKVFSIERLRRVRIEGKTAHRHRVGEVEYRIGYYIASGKPGPRQGTWLWAQYCPMIPKKDFEPLFKRAKSQGVIV